MRHAFRAKHSDLSEDLDVLEALGLFHLGLEM